MKNKGYTYKTSYHLCKLVIQKGHFLTVKNISKLSAVLNENKSLRANNKKLMQKIK